MTYLTKTTLLSALTDLKGTADHLIKIWFTLKQMGMDAQHHVVIDTTSSHDALERLFSYGSPSHEFFIPFAHTDRFMTMKADADRSIIQTNLKRWAVSGSVVTVDPTGYLDILEQTDETLIVRPGRNYPLGLGFGKNGFALKEDARVAIPLLGFAVWYYRQRSIEWQGELLEHLSELLRQDLNLSVAEQELVFVARPSTWTPSFQDRQMTDAEVYETVQESLNATIMPSTILRESYQEYSTQVSSMTTTMPGPRWLNYEPISRLRSLIEAGSKAILLYGPPRTGKTHAVDTICSRTSAQRETIQIHSGWGYDELILGLRPDIEGRWAYVKGPLLRAVESSKEFIVLEEINRTEFSQAIGEVLSLIEAGYRGPSYKIRLRDGSQFYLSESTLIICTMNTLDRSTEELDDAIFGRMDAVEFLPRVEDLQQMLAVSGISDQSAQNVRLLFAHIQQYYPLGHGYFTDLRSNSDVVQYYLSRIRPVLQKHMKDYRDLELASIDEKVDELFGQQ